MDPWLILLLLALLAGVMGWITTPFVNGILWYCDWREGAPINWGLDTAFAIAVPFAWMFSLLEIVILYMK